MECINWVLSCALHTNEVATNPSIGLGENGLVYDGWVETHEHGDNGMYLHYRYKVIVDDTPGGGFLRFRVWLTPDELAVQAGCVPFSYGTTAKPPHGVVADFNTRLDGLLA